MTTGCNSLEQMGLETISVEGNPEGKQLGELVRYAHPPKAENNGPIEY